MNRSSKKNYLGLRGADLVRLKVNAQATTMMWRSWSGVYDRLGVIPTALGDWYRDFANDTYFLYWDYDFNWVSANVIARVLPDADIRAATILDENGRVIARRLVDLTRKENGRGV